MNIWADFRKLLASLWLGATLFFSFAVAPSAFAVLPSTELAGDIVSRTLEIINYSGMIIGLILLLTSFVFAPKGFLVWIERLLSVVLIAACAVGQFYVGWQMRSLRAQMQGPVERLATDDPLRVAFNMLHGYSVYVLLTGIIAALILFFMIVRRPKEIVAVRTNEFDLIK